MNNAAAATTTTATNELDLEQSVDRLCRYLSDDEDEEATTTTGSSTTTATTSNSGSITNNKNKENNGGDRRVIVPKLTLSNSVYQPRSQRPTLPSKYRFILCYIYQLDRSYLDIECIVDT